MGLRHHVREVLRIAPVPSPWPRMVICALATSLPLVFGLLSNQLPISIFGALVGFLLVLNDHFGTLGHRLWVITLTFLILLGGLTTGILLHEHKTLFVPILLALTYWMGLMSGEGAELERALLFGIFQLLAGAYTPGIAKYYDLVLVYALSGYVCVVVLLTLLVFLRRHNPNPFVSLRTTFKNTLTKDPRRHLYAFSFCLSVALSLVIVDLLKINHGYWAVGTVLIILRPDIKLSIYRGIQRFFGTLVGVLIAEAIIYFVHSPLIAIALIALVAFMSPWALPRSYWLGSAVVAVMILLVLDMPSIEKGDFHTPLLRLQATGIGCLLSLIGIVIANPKILWQDGPPKT